MRQHLTLGIFINRHAAEEFVRRIE